MKFFRHLRDPVVGFAAGLLVAASMVALGANVYTQIQFGGALAGSTWNNQTLAASSVNLASSTVTGTLPVTNGGTGIAGVSQGDVLYGSASNTISALAKSATATRYLANTGTTNNPAWAQVNLANGVSGSLPQANLALPTETNFTAAGAVTITTSHYYVCINKTVGAATTANLPSSPAVGRTYIISDCKGDAATNNITITPAAGNIDGAGTFVLNTNYGNWFGYYNGTFWKTIASR